MFAIGFLTGIVLIIGIFEWRTGIIRDEWNNLFDFDFEIDLTGIYDEL